MDNIEIKLKFKTISSVILSPRVEKALYKGIDFKSIKNDDKTKMIYPFYSYCDRELDADKDYSKDDIDYYIPASSLKGALLCENKTEEKSIRSKILVKDINRLKDNIKLDNLYKFQYLYEKKDNNEKNKTETAQTSTATYDKKKYNNETNKIPKYTVFFPGVAIEMLESKKEFESEILMKSSEITEEIFMKKLNEVFVSTKNKLDNYLKETKERIEYTQACVKEKLKKVENNIKQLDSNKNMIFLSDYKGILGSLSQSDLFQQNKEPRITNGFYIDEETLLPYGLVEVCPPNQV